MKNISSKYGIVNYDNTLAYILDGFVTQIICALNDTTEVYKNIDDQEMLMYRVSDDMQEMQTQMMVDHHLQQLDERFRQLIFDYIKENKLYISRRKEQKQRIVLLQEAQLSEYTEALAS